MQATAGPAPDPEEPPPPPIGALPAEHGVFFPGTSGDLFSLSAAQLAALQAFYGEPLWQHSPSVREKRAAFARFAGVM